MKHFFISYSRVDAEFGENLVNRMRAQGFETWVDTEQVLPGHDWRMTIDEAIRASAAVIVVMTPAAKASEYVTYEWAYALGAEIPVIPVLLDRTDLHPRLAVLQYLQFTVPIHLRPWERLFESLRAALPLEVPAPQTEPVDVQKLVTQLDSSDPAVRKNAISSLVTADQGDAYQALVAALEHRRRDVRINAAIKLAKQKNEDAIPALVDALYGPDTQLAEEASEALIRIGNPILLTMITALQNQSLEVKRQAIWILGQLRNATAIPALVELLQEEKLLNSDKSFVDIFYVKKSLELTIQALTNIGGSDIVPIIINFLEGISSRLEQGANIQYEVNTRDLIYLSIAILGRIGSPEAVPFLVKTLQLPRLEEFRTAISTALLEIGGPTVIEKLRSLLHDPACPQMLELTVRNLLQRLGAPDI